MLQHATAAINKGYKLIQLGYNKPLRNTAYFLKLLEAYLPLQKIINN